MRTWNRFLRAGMRVAATVVCILPMAAQATVGLTVTIEEGDSPTNFLRQTATCYGTPTCTGVFTITFRETGCNNGFSFDGTVTITGVDLSHPGAFSGTYTLSVDTVSDTNVNGVCTYTLGPGPTGSYTATWDGVKGTVTIAVPGEPAPFIGRFTAVGVAAPPVFPMTVTPNITPTTANVSAQIQPRPQDAGTTQSVFVFAYAPQSRIGKRLPAGGPIRAGLEDGPDPCVLAQVNANGQLTAASSSTLTPTTTTVLTSQGTAITILGNTPTPNVAGATMYVGYGPNSTTMFGTGTYQGAVNIPGATQCTSNLASSAVAAPTGALTGLWWKSDESGWGIHFTQRGTNVFAAWYTYDSAGKPKWYVSTCSAGTSGTTGTCGGILYEVNGPTFFGGSFNPSLVNAVNAGNLQLNFSNPNSVAMTYTVGAQTRSLNLTRQPLATGAAPPAIDFSDIWWGGSSESGWGMAMAQQFGITFLAWYVYDSSGKPTWLVATCTMSGMNCGGTLFRTTGPPFGPTFNPSAVQATPAGTISVSFTDPNNAILNYTVDGVSGRKAVTRQLF